MAAQIIGTALRLPVFKVELGDVLSRTEQDTEAVIGGVFASADASGAILLFKGAELLVPRQSRAERRERLAGRVAQRPREDLLASKNGETDPALSDLLERSRRHDRLVIFAAAPTGGLEPSFARRFDVVVNFPFPDSTARKDIWRRTLPGDARVTESGLDYLARWLRWPGSTIRSCCEAAASNAAGEGVPMQLHHVATMLERGYRRRVPPAYAGEAPFSKPTPEGAASVEPLPEESRTRSGAPQVLRRTGTKWALSGALIAAGLGAVVAITRPTVVSQTNTNARAGVVRISYPANWRPGSATATPQLRLADELALTAAAPARGSLLVGRTPAESANALPQSLIAGLAARPQIVKIGPVSLYRYVSSPQPGLRTSRAVYTAPTTVGTIVGVCTTTEAPASFISNCEHVLGTIRLTSGSFLPLGLTTSYAHTINAVITKLNAVRSRAGAELAHATNAQAQEIAAATLARAHAEAASDLARTSAGSAWVANTALANALLMTANAYRALALAASRADPRSYGAARAELARAAEALSLGFAQISRLGYRVA
ncbi:MAG: hypothetical protein JO181_20130 [Solirubrobacterales bacterium]|nr:hypothetical protein [Solirubrobacterales bacterium]